MSSDGVRIDFFARGAGPVVFACHGGPANICDTLAASLTGLEEYHTVVYHDYRGSGRSQNASRESYTFERLADDLDELRRHLGHGAVPVLAHSMGGFVALNFALRHPEGCAGLILVGTTPTGDPRKIAGPALRALGPARLAKLIARALWYLVVWAWRPESPRRREARYAIVAVAQEGLPPAPARVREATAMQPVTNDNVSSLERLFSRTDLTALLPDIRCPALIVCGQRDAMMTAGCRLLKAGLPMATTFVVPHVGHDPFLEDPERVFPAIRKFIATI